MYPYWPSLDDLIRLADPPGVCTFGQGGWAKVNFWEFDNVDFLGIALFTTVWEAPVKDLY